MKIKRILIVLGVLILTFFASETLILGYEKKDIMTGHLNFRWSGLDALWKKNERFGFLSNQPIETNFDGLDGPYIHNDSIYTVKNNTIVKEVLSDSALRVAVNSSSIESFTVTLQKPRIVRDNFRNYDKIVVISDIEGQFTPFFNLLFRNQIVDEKGNWIFNDGHLVLNGDFMDRGNEVTQVLWLIYKLEYQAERQNGHVSFIMGNHEQLNLLGVPQDVQLKYIHLAKQLYKTDDWSESIQKLYSKSTHLGSWLRNHPALVKIGPYLFCHGGLNMTHVRNNIEIQEYNDILLQGHQTESIAEYNALVNSTPKYRAALSSKQSVLWERGLTTGWKKYFLTLYGGTLTNEAQLDSILNFYDAEKLIIGHTPVEDVSFSYHNKVINVDVDHSSNPKGIIIYNRNEIRIIDTTI